MTTAFQIGAFQFSAFQEQQPGSGSSVTRQLINRVRSMRAEAAERRRIEEEQRKRDEEAAALAAMPVYVDLRTMTARAAHGHPLTSLGALPHARQTSAEDRAFRKLVEELAESDL